MERDDDGSVGISTTAHGVTSVFTLDLYTLTLKLDTQKSYDLFDGSSDAHTDISSRPIKSAEVIHEERKEIIREILRELDDPSLIETD